jgi:hypothetical protein
LEQLPIIKFPFKLEQLPENGIYFFYEDGEYWGHGGFKARIVRIGTHKDGNFKSRIKEHFLLDESKMNFDRNKAAPRERSIFRKHIGRALLNKRHDDYLKIWEIDFTSKKSREEFGHLRNIQKEIEVESAITKILRQNFSFRFIIVDDQLNRMGSGGLERSLIGTVAHCELCKPTGNWSGGYSPKKQIKESGLWLVHHLKANDISEGDKSAILSAIAKTRKWVRQEIT